MTNNTIEKFIEGEMYLLDKLHESCDYLGKWKQKNWGSLFQDSTFLYLVDKVGHYGVVREKYGIATR